ncbi:DNA-directed RNA polymerase subunit delta [Mesoplasma chauliocola]|uniref:RNAP delta factor n=1 Tax=Mesoplasma chauliocola TaxID=216427 RepID=A0A249SP69_9MOLU|nr:DNA-directed RNA polymerase subunit delta [Mesoplasma chauliocola]ASZ09417.1 DNA-directed RNA polymerase subunit delta [Mesoplasma chauliocola]
MENLSNIDLAYAFLKKRKNPVKLMDIWDAIKDKAINHKNDENEAIADLYSDLVLDVRFALSPKGEWALSDDSKIEDIKKKFVEKPVKKKMISLDEDAEDLTEENINSDEDEEDPEIYDDLFVEEEEDDATSIYYDEDEDM